MLSGLIPDEGNDSDALKRRLLCGRYAELRMLFFLGKDVFRWIDQCVEWAERVPEFSALEIRRQSFAGLLTKDPPEAVREKLVRLGRGGLPIDFFARDRDERGVCRTAGDGNAQRRISYAPTTGIPISCTAVIWNRKRTRVCARRIFDLRFTRQGNTRECWRRSGTGTRRIEPALLIRIEVAIQVDPKDACEAGHGRHQGQVCHKGRHQHEVEAPGGQPPEQ